MSWKYIIIHQSWSPDHPKILDYAGIENYHINWAYEGNIISEIEGQQLKKEGKKVKEPFDEIGYEFIIEMVSGKPLIIVGRMLDREGAHCIGRNHDSIGICIIGNYDIASPSQETWEKLVKLCKSLCKVFDIAPKNIKGHRDFAPYKTCPGINIDIQKLIDDVARSIIGNVYSKELGIRYDNERIR